MSTLEELITPPAPPDDGEAPEAAAEPYVPPEVVVYRPSMANLLKEQDGTVQLEFMISPLKVIAVRLPEEAARELASQITSSIVVAKAMPHMAVPRGRRP